jgi:peptidoglycan/LPS O-acetylase OafA/YrhL
MQLSAPLAPTIPASGVSRLAGIEGLRAVAATSIVIYHTWLFSSPTDQRVGLGPFNNVAHDLGYGVTLFFALSGFLLYRPYAAAFMRSQRPPSPRRYFRNRALRILPAYWVILLATGLVFQSMLIRHGASIDNGSGADVGLLGRNALLIQNYAPGTLATGIGPAWSLAVEVVFYVALPVLALGAAVLVRRATGRGGRRLAALAPAAALLVLGLFGKALAAHVVRPVGLDPGWDNDWYSVLERSFLCQADLFAFGMALAVVFVDWEDGRLRLPRRWRMFAAVVAASAYVVTTTRISDSEQLGNSSYNTLMALSLTLVLALVVVAPGEAKGTRAFLRVLEHPVLIAGGLISYSMFLWHEPIVRFLHDHGLVAAGPVGLALNLVVVMVATTALSVLTYRFVESVALRRKQREQRQPLPA